MKILIGLLCLTLSFAIHSPKPWIDPAPSDHIPAEPAPVDPSDRPPRPDLPNPGFPPPPPPADTACLSILTKLEYKIQELEAKIASLEAKQEGCTSYLSVLKQALTSDTNLVFDGSRTPFISLFASGKINEIPPFWAQIKGQGVQVNCQ